MNSNKYTSKEHNEDGLYDMRVHLLAQLFNAEMESQEF